VYPAEVEATLLAHPLVAEAAVVGVADETWGSRVVALVRLGETTPPADVVAQLAAHCRASLAAYKTPREIIVATAPLPRTASGKLRRAEVRASLAGPRTPPISAPGTTPGAS
jgi:long-chain acyl-CoA synthetase